MPVKSVGLHTGHRARMREKFINYGRDVFHTHELLEMFLFYAVPQKNTNDTAKLLLERFGSLDGVLSAGREELCEVKGVGGKVADMIVEAGKISLRKEKTFGEVSEYTTAGIFFAKIFENDKSANSSVILLGNRMNLVGCRTFTDGDFCIQKFVDAVISSRASAAVIAFRHESPGFSEFEECSKNGKIASALSASGALLLECYSVSDSGFEVLQNGPDVKICLSDGNSENEKKRLTTLFSFISKSPDLSAEKLLKNFSSFLAVAEADIDKINEITGEKTTSIYIKLISALVSRRNTDLFRFEKIHTDEEIGEYLKALLFGISDETVYLLSLDGGRVISCDKVGEGCVNVAAATPRKLLEIAKKRSAESVIVAHNHPGGKALPSDEDKSVGTLLFEIFSSAGIDFSCQYVTAGFDFIKV